MLKDGWLTFQRTNDPAYLPDPLVVLAFEERTTTPSVVSRRDRIFAWEERKREKKYINREFIR